MPCEGGDRQTDRRVPGPGSAVKTDLGSTTSLCGWDREQLSLAWRRSNQLQPAPLEKSKVQKSDVSTAWFSYPQSLFQVATLTCKALFMFSLIACAFCACCSWNRSWATSCTEPGGGKIRECTKGKGMKNLWCTEELESAEATEGGVPLCYLVIAFLGGQRYSQWDREGIGPDISETCPHI